MGDVMATRCRPRPMVAGTYGVFYALDGSGEPYAGELEKEPEAEFAVIQEFNPAGRRRKGSFDVVLAKSTKLPMKPEFFLCDICSVETEGHLRRDCGQSPLHITGGWGHRGIYDLFGGPNLSAFQRTTLPGFNLIPLVFRNALTEAGFTGVSFTEWELNIAQTKYCPGPLYLLEATGHNCVWPAEIVGGPNACGFCGFELVVCLECGHLWRKCPACEQEIYASAQQHGGIADQRILFETPKRNSDLRQIDASKWRGEDFVNIHGGCVVTRRVVDWLKAHRAGPWIAYPVKCELAGVSDEMTARLLDAAGSGRAMVERALELRDQER